MTRSGERYYLVKWEGYGLSESTWEPEANCADCTEAIDELNARNNPPPPDGAPKMPPALIAQLPASSGRGGRGRPRGSSKRARGSHGGAKNTGSRDRERDRDESDDEMSAADSEDASDGGSASAGSDTRTSSDDTLPLRLKLSNNNTNSKSDPPPPKSLDSFPPIVITSAEFKRPANQPTHEFLITSSDGGTEIGHCDVCDRTEYFLDGETDPVCL